MEKSSGIPLILQKYLAQTVGFWIGQALIQVAQCDRRATSIRFEDGHAVLARYRTFSMDPRPWVIIEPQQDRQSLPLRQVSTIIDEAALSPANFTIPLRPLTCRCWLSGRRAGSAGQDRQVVPSKLFLRHTRPIVFDDNRFAAQRLRS